MEYENEPQLSVHLIEKAMLDGQTLDPDMYTVNLCLASEWVSKGMAHILQPSKVNQAAIVNWVNSEGFRLTDLGKQVGVSKAMLSQVMHGKKRLSKEKLLAVLAAYTCWDDS